jgi:hypothetical protein
LIEYVQKPSCYHKYADERFNDDKFTSTLLTARLALARKVIFSFINWFRRVIRLLIVSIISSRKLERAFPSLKIITKLIIFVFSNLLLCRKSYSSFVLQAALLLLEARSVLIAKIMEDS